MGHGFNEAGTLSQSPADASNDLLPPTPVHTTNPNQSFPTTINELTGSADQESVVGGAYGASPPGTEGTPCTKETDYWILFPERFESALCKEIRSKGIGMTVVHTNTLKDANNDYLGLVKKHRVNLIIDLPKRESGQGVSARMTKHFSRVQKYASVANKVYIIAPQSNGQWQEWKPWFSEHHDTYRPTLHFWCNFGIHDKGAGSPSAAVKEK